MIPLLRGSRAFWALGDASAVMPATHIEVQYARAVDMPSNATPRYNTRYAEGYAPVRILLEIPIWYPLPNRLSVFDPLFVAWAFPNPHTDYQQPPALPVYCYLQNTVRTFPSVVVQSATLHIIKNQHLSLQLQCIANTEATPVVGPTHWWAHWGNVAPTLMSYRNVVFLTLAGANWNLLQGVPIYDCTITTTRHVRPVAPISGDPILNVAGGTARVDAAQMRANAQIRIQAREPNPFNSTAFAFGVRIGDASNTYMEIRMPRLVPINPYDSHYQHGAMFRTVQCECAGVGAHPPALVIT